MEYLKNIYGNNKKKVWAFGVFSLIIIGIILGMMARPAFDRAVQNFDDMFGAVKVENIVYEGNEEQKATRELMKSDEFQTVAQNMALAIYNKRMAEETLKKAEGFAARKGYNLDKLDERLSNMMGLASSTKK